MFFLILGSEEGRERNMDQPTPPSPPPNMHLPHPLTGPVTRE